jgi:ParB/RepB/Spo0J family partition protein
LTTTIKQTKRIRIEDIIVGNRFRKDLGDIDSLTKTIRDVGLLQPIGITENNQLVYGARRLQACKRLGWTEIPVNVITLKDIIKGEFVENSARKDFTFSERQAILEEIESKRIGHKTPKGAKLAPFQEQEKGKKSRELVAKYTGVSPAQLSKEKTIFQAVKEKPSLYYVIDQLDKEEISVNRADEIIKQEEIMRETEIPEPQIPEEPEAGPDFDDAELKQFAIHGMEEELNRAKHKLWCALTGRKQWPAAQDDLQVDYIRPTRQFRNNLFYELAKMGTLGTMSTNGHYKTLNQLRAVIDDALQIIEKLQN